MDTDWFLCCAVNSEIKSTESACKVCALDQVLCMDFFVVIPIDIIEAPSQ